MIQTVDFFVPPDDWFEILEEVSAAHSSEVVFQRYRTEAHEEGFHLASLGFLKDEFEQGQYDQIWISGSLVPAHEKDWEFIARTKYDLLESTGGHWRNSRLELRTLGVFTDPSRVTELFNAFKEAIEAICNRGMRSEGVDEPDVLYVPDSGWSYVSDLEEGAEEYTPLA